MRTTTEPRYYVADHAGRACIYDRKRASDKTETGHACDAIYSDPEVAAWVCEQMNRQDRSPT